MVVIISVVRVRIHRGALSKSYTHFFLRGLANFLCVTVVSISGKFTEFKGIVTLVFGAPVAQWIKRWPTDLASWDRFPAKGEIFSIVNGIPLPQPFIILILL